MQPVDTRPARVDPERAAAKAEARPGAGNDWAVQTADTIERLVESVRSNTSDRLVSITRLVVFGLVAAILGTAALVLFSIFVVRLLDSYLPGGVWVAHLVVGGVFTLVGLLLWQRAWKRPDRER
jgi:drug/metabolite transporter (DMT)-like permease